MNRCRRVVVLTVSILGCPLPSHATPGPPPAVSIDTLLAAPASPGSIGLLVDHMETPAAVARVAAALGDANPQTRAAAARVAFARPLPALRQPLLQALADEADADATWEMLRAAAWLSEMDDAPVLIAAARRLGRFGMVGLAREFGRLPAARALASIPALHALRPDANTWTLFIEGATQEGQPIPPFAEAALAAGDEELWALLLNRRMFPGSRWLIRAELLAEGLVSENAGIRAATAWHVALAPRADHAHAEILVPAIERALALPQEAPPALAPGLALAQRAFGGPRLDSPPLIAYARTVELDQPLLPQGDLGCSLAAAAALLTDQEHRAAEPALRRTRLLRGLPLPTRPPPPPSRANTVTTINLPAGMLASLLDVSGCRPGPGVRLMGGRVRYGEDGRPRDRIVPADAPRDACGTALRALLALATTDHDLERLGTETVVVSLVPTHVACSSAELPRPPAGARDEKDAQPLHAPAPTTGRWTLAVEGTISPTGCVARVKVGGVGGLRDPVGLLEAVLDWRFKPAEADGRAVAQFFFHSFDGIRYRGLTKRPDIVTCAWPD